MLKTLFIALALMSTAQAADEAKGSFLSDRPLNPEEFTTPPAESMPRVLWFWHQTAMTTVNFNCQRRI